MRHNNQFSANDEVQNRFTGYLLRAVGYRRREYFEKLHLQKEHEIMDDKMLSSSMASEDNVFEQFSIMHKLDNTALWRALNQLSDRERYILLERVVCERSFDELAAELGIGYKGAAAIYYRAIKKIKNGMMR